MDVHEGPINAPGIISRTNGFKQYKYIYRVCLSSRQRVLFGYKTSGVRDIHPRGMY